MKFRARTSGLVAAALALLLVLAYATYLVDTRRKDVDTATPAPAQERVSVPAAVEPAEGTVEAFGDLDLPPPRPSPVDASDDRGIEVLDLGERRCAALPPQFQSRVIGERKCQVYLHDLARDGGAIIIMASPKFGVQQTNGRPLMVVLPAKAYRGAEN